MRRTPEFDARMKAQGALNARRKRFSQLPYDFATILERTPGYIKSKRLLPCSKGELTEAFLFCLANAKSKVEFELLSGAMTHLVFFQDIGDRDDLTPPDFNATNMVSKAAASAYLTRFTTEYAPHVDKVRPQMDFDFAFFVEWSAKARAANIFLAHPLKRMWWKMKNGDLPEWIDFPTDY